MSTPPRPVSAEEFREVQFQRFLALARSGPGWKEYWQTELRRLQKWDDENYKYGWWRGLFRRIAEATKDDNTSNG